MPLPDPHLLTAALAHLVVPGSDLQIAGPDGRCSRVRVKMLANDCLVGSMPAGRLAPGAIAIARVWANERVNLLSLAVEEVEATILDRMDVLLRLVGLDQLADQRGTDRADCDQEAVVVRTSDAERGIARAPVAAHVVSVSANGLGLVADRRFDDRDHLDVRFDDGTGARVACRVRVERASAPLYGRTRHGCSIVAISEVDARRLANLVSRLRFAALAPVEDEHAEQEDEGRRGLRRLLRRAG